MSWVKLKNSSSLMENDSRNVSAVNLQPHSSSSSLLSFLSLNSAVFYIETALLCGVLVVWLRRKTGFSHARKESEVPVLSFFPVPVPDFVNALYLIYTFKKVGLACLQEIISKYGTIVQAPLGFGFGTMYGVADPAVAQKILSSTSPKLLNKPRHIYDALFPLELKNGLISLEYDVWTNYRKVLAHSFTYSSLQAYLEVMNGHGEELTDKLLSLCSSSDAGGVVEGKKVEELIWSETIKIILQAAMGSDCCSDEESAEIANCFHRYKYITQQRLQNPFLLFRPIWWLHPNRVESERVFFALRELLTKKIKMFRDEPNEIEVAEDEGKTRQSCVIENMISNGASDLEIYAEILAFVFGGHETTSNAITMLLFHLACNPECQALCQDEISQIWGDPHSDTKVFSLGMSHIAQLKYLERCISEGLRISPTVPVFLRRLDSPLETDGKLIFEKGRAAVISPWGIHHNPDIYPDPEKFDPDRFLKENVQKRHSYAYMPFSHGPRNCIGYKYAILEMKVILARILHHFEVSTGVDPKSVKYLMEMTLMPDRDLNIKLKKR